MHSSLCLLDYPNVYYLLIISIDEYFPVFFEPGLRPSQKVIQLLAHYDNFSDIVLSHLSPSDADETWYRKFMHNIVEFAHQNHYLFSSIDEASFHRCTDDIIVTAVDRDVFPSQLAPMYELTVTDGVLYADLAGIWYDDQHHNTHATSEPYPSLLVVYRD